MFIHAQTKECPKKQWIIVISSANITHGYEFDHDLSDSGLGFERKYCILYNIIHIFVV